MRTETVIPNKNGINANETHCGFRDLDSAGFGVVASEIGFEEGGLAEPGIITSCQFSPSATNKAIKLPTSMPADPSGT